MSMPNPLDTIMTQLRRKGSLEPGDSEVRQANMAVEQRRMGMSPGTQMGARPPQDELSSVLQQIGETKAAQPSVEVAQGDMLPILADQLNEAIITLKVQIGRTPDPEARKRLEQQTKLLRQMVMDVGGEPIRADESVEEGLQKIQGYGQVGGEQLRARLGLGPVRNTAQPSTVPTMPPPVSVPGTQSAIQSASLPLGATMPYASQVTRPYVPRQVAGTSTQNARQAVNAWAKVGARYRRGGGIENV